MKSLIFKLIVCLSVAFPLYVSGSQLEADSLSSKVHIINKTENKDTLTSYEKRLLKYMTSWNKLIPSYTKLQYAGNMGLLSGGIGWSYGKNKQWETDLLLGFLPKYDSKSAKFTLTLRENFIPWKKHMWDQFYIEPLACGIYLNTVLDGEFWVSQPDRYPQGYYWFATKLRINAYVGQRFTYKIKPSKRFLSHSITFYYELSTCDYYVIQKIHNSYLTFPDYVSLSFGLKFQWL